MKKRMKNLFKVTMTLAITLIMSVSVSPINVHATTTCNNHMWVCIRVIQERTCTQDGKYEMKCAKCGIKQNSLKIEPKVGHKELKVTTKKPTCASSGLEVGKCERCNVQLSSKNSAR